MRRLRQLVMFLLAAGLAGCASLGVPPADTFNKKVFVAYTTATEILTQTGILLDAKKITPDDADNIRRQARGLETGLKVARGLYTTNPSAAQDRLTAAITGLTALQVYLASRR